MRETDTDEHPAWDKRYRPTNASRLVRSLRVADGAQYMLRSRNACVRVSEEQMALHRIGDTARAHIHEEDEAPRGLRSRDPR